MAVTGTSLFIILFLGLAFYSCAAPTDRKPPKDKIQYLFRTMQLICEYDPDVHQLVRDTKMAYAKEHFGDAEESRVVSIRGVQSLETYQKIPVQKFASKAYKQLSIYLSIFQDIKHQLNQSQEEPKEIVKSLGAIVSKIRKLRTKMGIVLSYYHHLPDVKPFGTTTIWNKSPLEQKSWILGVLQDFKESIRYMHLAFKMHAED